jgi:hypothetical protein
MFLQNVGWLSTDYTALYPRRWYSSIFFFITAINMLLLKLLIPNICTKRIKISSFFLGWKWVYIRGHLKVVNILSHKTAFILCVCEWESRSRRVRWRSSPPTRPHVQSYARLQREHNVWKYGWPKQSVTCSLIQQIFKTLDWGGDVHEYLQQIPSSEVWEGNEKKSSIFRDITPCSALKINGCFGGTCGLHLQGRKISREKTNVKVGGKHSL